MNEIINELIISMKQLEEKDLMYILGVVNGMAINKEMEKKKNE